MNGSSPAPAFKPQFAPDENFTEIHLWYKRDKAGNLLPRMARTIDKSNNVSIVQLINVAVQRTGEAANQAASVPTEMLDTQQPVSGWDVQVIPWQKPAAQPASGSRESGAGGWGAGGGRGSADQPTLQRAPRDRHGLYAAWIPRSRNPRRRPR